MTMMLMGAGGFAAAASPGSGWNTGEGGAGGYAFTGTNNSTATRNAVNGSPRNLRGTQGHATGKWYFEADLTDLAFGNTDARIGIGNSSAAVTAYEGGVNVAIANLNGDLGGNSTSLGTFTAQPDGNRFGFAVDLTAGKLYIRDESGWLLGGDPNAGGTGISISYLTGTIYPFVQTTTTGDNTTLYTAAADLPNLPAGFGAWL